MTEPFNSPYVLVMKPTVHRVVVLLIAARPSLWTSQRTTALCGTFSELSIHSRSVQRHRSSTSSCRRRPRLATPLFAGGNQFYLQVFDFVYFSIFMAASGVV